MSYSVYILRCADGSLYTGIALDVRRRLEEHRSGIRGAKYLRGRLPVELVFECAAGERGDALRLEHRVKRMSKREKELLIAGGLAPRANDGALQASGRSSG
ncbi:MAG: GIY-YIG nuclease family protein [Woeseiaceae bacterium]